MNSVASSNDLYRAVVLEHAHTPRNFGRRAGATHHAEGHNRLCGDSIQLFIRAVNARLEDVAFEGNGCAISIASASMLTDMLIGTSERKATELIGNVCDWFEARGSPAAGHPLAIAGAPIESLAEVRRYPSRVQCATLPWRTALAALSAAPRVPPPERQERG